MAVPYNHKAIEQKWRENWEAKPVNVDDGKKPKYYCLDMLLIFAMFCAVDFAGCTPILIA